MKKVIYVVGAIFMLANCGETTLDITPVVETVTVYPQRNPDVVSLIENEVKSTQNWDTETTDTTIQISYEDAQRLMKIAYAEAGGEGIDGQLKVMQTVWNRVISDDYPDSIQSVIEQPSQFSSVENGHYASAEPTYETHLALAKFESGHYQDDELIGFETNTNGKVLLKYFDFYYVFGNHTFYKLKKD